MLSLPHTFFCPHEAFISSSYNTQTTVLPIPRALEHKPCLSPGTGTAGAPCQSVTIHTCSQQHACNAPLPCLVFSLEQNQLFHFTWQKLVFRILGFSLANPFNSWPGLPAPMDNTPIPVRDPRPSTSLAKECRFGSILSSFLYWPVDQG